VKTLYAVSSGSYSDYSVDAIFSSKEKATEFMRMVPDGDYNGIEVYELDPPYVDKIKKGYSIWDILMLRDGTVERVHRSELRKWEVLRSSEPRIWQRTKAPAYKGKGIPDCLQVSVWAKTEEQAVKIANEKRVEMIAMGKWE
jgi:hypothetical protein